MPIYESKGFGNDLHLFDKKSPFNYVAERRPMKVPQGENIDDFKRNSAPYCIAGKVKQDENGNYKRNNASLIYRDLIFLDYDELEANIDFPSVVENALHGYSYIVYPTIKHTANKPRYRLVVNRGRDYPVANTVTASQKPYYHTPRPSGNKTITMRVLDTLFHGFGDEGGRNVAVTRFVGLLLSKWVDADVATAYELTTIANSVTDNPLPVEELARTFESIVKAEIRKRGVNGN